MNRTDAVAFARCWAEHWNSGDLDSILRPLADDAVFVSPRAEDLVGSSRLEGKEAIRRYWTIPFDRGLSFGFDLDNVVWDQESQTLVVIYTSRLGGRETRACELMRFDRTGRQCYGEAYYGARSPGE